MSVSTFVPENKEGEGQLGKCQQGWGEHWRTMQSPSNVIAALCRNQALPGISG